MDSILSDILSYINSTLVVAVAGISLCVSNVIRACKSKTELISKDDEDLVSKGIKSFLKKVYYHPTFYLMHPYAQVLFHVLFKNPKVNLKREYFTLSCGGIVALDHAMFPFGKALHELSKKRRESIISSKQANALLKANLNALIRVKDEENLKNENNVEEKLSKDSTTENENFNNNNKDAFKDYFSNNTNNILTTTDRSDDEMEKSNNNNINNKKNTKSTKNTLNTEDQKGENFVSNFNKIARKHKERILVILHGVLGGSDSPQMKDLINYYTMKENIFFDQIISIQNKGINDTPLSHPKPYNLASFSDTKEVIDHVIHTHNDCELYLIGISLGSLLLSQMLILYPDIKNIKAFVSISNPFDLRLSYSNFTFLTDKFLTTVLKQRIINQPILEARVKKETVLKLNSVIEFEEEFNKKVHPEITDTNEYLEKFSISSRLPQLKYYSLFINAEDDKISPITEICNSQCKF